MNAATVIPDPMQIARHIDDVAGRYACYPGIAQFHPGFGDAGFVEALRISNGDPIPAKLSIHIGVPDAFGLYAIDGAATAPRAGSRPAAYLQRLIRQIAAIGALCDRDRDVVQLGLSPGATDYFDADAIAEIVDSLSRNFHFSTMPGRDFAATVAPDTATDADLRRLVEVGCNRAGFALALDEVSSTPSSSTAADTVARCREAGFQHVRIDVLFGARSGDPEQFPARFAAVVRAAPDVIALRDVAHLPESFAPGRVVAHDAEVRARMLCAAWRVLDDAGYAHLGMGVFVLPGDPLLRAKARRRLHRDALGFGAQGTTDLVGFGVGAIQQIGGAYCRAIPHLREWEAAIDAGRLGIDAGLALSADDLVRASVIQSILCTDGVDLARIGERHDIDPADYFEDELRALAGLANDGLLGFDDAGPAAGFALTPAGRLLSRVVASRFDVSLRRSVLPRAMPR